MQKKASEDAVAAHPTRPTKLIQRSAYLVWCMRMCWWALHRMLISPNATDMMFVQFKLLYLDGTNKVFYVKQLHL